MFALHLILKLLQANVSDPTGDQRVTAFNETAEAMLGKSAEEIGRMSEYDKNAYTQLFDEVKFKTFVFRFRTKMETYSVSICISFFFLQATSLACTK